MRFPTLTASLAGVIVLSTLCGALAADKLTVAVVNPNSWDSGVVGFGKRLGFFAEKEIDVDVAKTDVISQSLQAVIAGSADIGIISTPIFMAAGLQGAPVKMIASAFKGTPDYLWYVRSDSTIQSYKDITEKTTVGISFLGSTADILVHSFFDQYGVKGQIVPVGNSAAGMVQVMAGQIDVGTDGNGLLGVPQYASGEVRTIAYGSELTIMNDVTVRGFVVTADTLAKRRDVLVRFLQAYQKTVDWMYQDPRAVQWFAEATQSTIDEATRVRDHSYPAGHLNVEDITGIDVTVAQSLAYKRIERAPTAQETAGMFQNIWHRGMP
jgi:NitT/TauT family transport system substrate-binding protein